MSLAREPELVRKDGVWVARYSDDVGTEELAKRQQLVDVDTNVGKETRRAKQTQDTLDRLLALKTRQGQAEQFERLYQAGRKFQRLFHVAGFSRSDSPQWDRLPGQLDVGRPGSDREADAKDKLDGALQALGGGSSPAGHTMWYVAGVGLSFRAYVHERDGRWTTNFKAASGALQSGLAVLANHWGL